MCRELTVSDTPVTHILKSNNHQIKYQMIVLQKGYTIEFSTNDGILLHNITYPTLEAADNAMSMVFPAILAIIKEDGELKL